MRYICYFLSLFCLLTSLSACSIKDFVSGVPQPGLCKKQGYAGNWYTPSGDKWTIRDDCSGTEAACGYTFDAFYVHGDGTAVLNLQSGYGIDGCLSAPQTHQCSFTQPATGQMLLSCEGLQIALNTRPPVTQGWQQVRYPYPQMRRRF